MPARSPLGNALGDRTDTIKSQLLRYFLEIVTLNDVANFVFGKVTEFDPAFDTRTDFFRIILKPA